MPIPVNGTVPANGVAGPKGQMRNNAAALRTALNAGGRFQASGAGSFEMTGEQKLRQKLSVKDFGNGVGTGGDDRAAIMRAMAYARTLVGQAYSQSSAGPPSAAQARYGAGVWFPPGRYQISSEIVQPHHIALLGCGTASVIQARPGFPGGQPLVRNEQGSDYGPKLHGITLDGANRALNGVRYRFDNAQTTDARSPWPTSDANPELENLLVFRTTGDGVDIGPQSGRSGFHMSNVIVMGCGGNGFTLGTTDVHAVNWFISEIGRHGLFNNGASSVFQNFLCQFCGLDGSGSGTSGNLGNGIRNEGNNTGFATCQTFATNAAGLHSQGGQIQNQAIAIDAPCRLSTIRPGAGGGNPSPQVGMSTAGNPQSLKGIYAVTNSVGGGNLQGGIQIVGGMTGCQLHVAADNVNTTRHNGGALSNRNAFTGTRPNNSPDTNV